MTGGAAHSSSVPALFTLLHRSCTAVRRDHLQQLLPNLHQNKHSKLHHHLKINLLVLFQEKPQTTQGWINGGFFVFESQFLDYINNDLTVLEKEPLSNLSNNRNLAAYKHDGFWQSMDNVRDLNVLKKLWNENIAPWK